MSSRTPSALSKSCTVSFQAKEESFILPTTSPEQQLTNTLTALLEQYEAEMEQQAEWGGELQEQVQRLGRTEALAENLKRQVKLLRRDYKEIAEVLRGV